MNYEHTQEDLDAIMHHNKQMIEHWQHTEEQLKLNNALNSFYLSLEWHKNILLTINTTLRIESLESLLNAFEKLKGEFESLKEKFKLMNVKSLQCNKLLLETKQLIELTQKRIKDEQQRTT